MDIQSSTLMHATTIVMGKLKLYALYYYLLTSLFYFYNFSILIALFLAGFQYE